MNEHMRIYLSYVIFFSYLFIVSIVIYLPIVTDTPPNDFIPGLKLVGSILSVTVGVALANILKNPHDGINRRSRIFLIIVTVFIVFTLCLVAIWPNIRGLPKEGYKDLLTLCSSFFIGLVSNFLLKGE